MSNLNTKWRGHAGRRLWWLAVGLLLAIDGRVETRAALGGQPLPDFQVVALNGQTTSSQQLATREQWLLVYLEPECRPCETALRVLAQDPPLTQLAQRVVIVAGGRDVAATQRLAQSFTWLPAEVWYADAERQSAAALGRRGAPLIYGLRGPRIEWSVSGALAETDKLAALMRPWIQP